MASVQGIGLNAKNRLQISEYKRTIEFEGKKPTGAGALPVISDASITLGGLDEELSVLDMASLRQQNAGVNGGGAPYVGPTRPNFGSSRFTVANGVIGGSVIGSGFSVGGKEDSIAAASLLGDDSATVYSQYTHALKSKQAKKTQWLTMATKVLRFYAWTQEAVPNSAIETGRVRKLVILYYLENDTMQVSEPKTPGNSGMTGGPWCKRSKVMNLETGQHFSPDDLAVGRDVAMMGRKLTIYDADEFTRNFYPAEMLAAQPIPEGSIEKAASAASRPEQPPSPRTLAARRLEGDKPEGGENLDFFGVWDDTMSEFGSLRPVKMTFFTEDGTLSLQEADGKPKRGRQRYRQILARGKVPRTLDSRSVDDIGFANNYATGYKAAESFIDVQDLQPGSTINVLNRSIEIKMVSKQTAAWWKARGLDIPDAAIQGLAEEVAAAEAKKVAAAKKPTEEDIKRADMKAFFERQAAFGTKALRFGAVDTSEVVSNSAVTVPSARTTDKATFTINFHLDDNSISVTVTAVENTGGPSGQFLRRMKLTNPATGLPFKATDFTPGTIVTLPNAKLEVLAMDSFTEQYLSGHFKRGTNLKQVFEKLRVKIKETRVNLHDVYLMIDTDRNGRVDQKEFMLLIDRGVGMGILSPDEVLVLFRKFDVDGTGSISWQNFVESIDNPDAWGATPSLTDMDPTEVDKYVSGLWASSESDKEQLKLERTMKVIQTFGEQMGLMNATKLFREFDLDHNGTVDQSEFRSVLINALFMNEQDVDLIVRKIWPSDPVNYENFFKVVSKYEVRWEKKKKRTLHQRPCPSSHTCT
jgi:Ca2+-binding EF-hand superfamily protein